MFRTLFFIMAVAFALPAFAQEEGDTDEPVVLAAGIVAPSALALAVSSYRTRTGLVPRTGHMGMVSGVCMYQDYDLPVDTDHSRAGQVLRLFTGECLQDSRGQVHDYVHDGSRFTRTLITVTKDEAAAILNAIPGSPGIAASAP